ncbi:tRNA (guanine-N1)-methyltransferase [Tamlana sp. 62-3]|uniref:tRNA (Guanine-N1)-methyltransferase n=1 Tax=Neotamlana sargassicola TaxID=2883125 RepID=A0A9X1I8B8_9FLAO|nr:tRNA (guanine-N1)-methyltransferase [Tamlana sargassicola]MCB4809333.1 tRNA (guanine-N1)-methyltransferase [Tamlana sargassicola]
MNALSSKFLLILICLFSSLSFSQTTEIEETQSINSGTIDNQFEYLLRKSGNFKGTNGQPYEAVKLSMINALRANTKDSLNTIKKNLADTKAVVNTQAKEISTLKSNLNSTQSSLDATNAEKDSMSLFGIQMSKTGYNSLMWIIIAALLALLLLFIYKFKNSNAVTKSAKKTLAETEEEFEQHRKVALEREQKVRRQLQDEINKQKNA